MDITRTKGGYPTNKNEMFFATFYKNKSHQKKVKGQFVNMLK